MRVAVHVDGACMGNPGPAGAGVVIADSRGKILRRVKSFLGNATNNVAEYCALIIGLREAKRLGATKVVCWTDSELLEKQLNGKFKIRDARLRSLSVEAMELAREFAEFSLKKVGREDNREADRLARKIIREKLAGPTPDSRRGRGSAKAAGKKRGNKKAAGK